MWEITALSTAGDPEQHSQQSWLVTLRYLSGRDENKAGEGGMRMSCTIKG